MDTINHIAKWFELAVPNPTDKNRAVQMGVHFEEVTEMLDAVGAPPTTREGLGALATRLKEKMTISCGDLDRAQKIELLDSLCDQIVTAVGVAHMFGLNICGALAEVNASNWSKFVEGEPVFNEHGKIAKGPNYRKPHLLGFVPQDISDAEVK